MECYHDSKYRLLGYCRTIERYMLTSRNYNDNEICVKSAMIKFDNDQIIRLPEGNPDNLVPDIDLSVFAR